MDNWMKLTEINWVLWIAGFFALLEFCKWAWSLIEYYLAKFDIETKNMKQKKAFDKRLKDTEEAIKDIKDTSKQNVDMFIEHEKKVVAHFEDIKNEVVTQLNDMNIRMDEQQQQIESRLESIDNDGKRRDATIFRDRLLQSHRFYNQRRNHDGFVYLSISEFENLQNMFREYFAANGNGVIKQIYEQDFQPNFRIDNESIDTYKTK